MEELDIAAKALGARLVLSALIDYMDVVDPDIRRTLVKGFGETMESSMLMGNTEQHDLMRRALREAMGIVEAKTEGPKLSIVPKE